MTDSSGSSLQYVSHDKDLRAHQAFLIDLMKQGKDAWNDWRNEESDQVVDLSLIDFGLKDILLFEFNGFQFGDNVNFNNSNFSARTTFDGAVFGNNTTFIRAHFGDYTSFVFSEFDNDVSFYTATFGNNIKFLETKFDGCVDLRRISFGANFSMRHTSFARGTLLATSFENMDLRYCDFENVSTSNLILDGADLRGMKNIKLDGTSIRSVRFDDKAPDPWSVLRRTYTGPAMAFTFLFLILFTIPYGAKIAYWVVLNKSQSHTASYTSSVLQLVQKNAENMSLSVATINEIIPTAQSIESLSTCASTECVEFSVWQLAIGLDNGKMVAFFIVLLMVYNALRGIITKMVVPMREQEERSGYSPAYATRINKYNDGRVETSVEYKDGALRFSRKQKHVPYSLKNLIRKLTKWRMRWGYNIFYRMHLVVEALFIISIGTMIWNTWHWLSQSIWIAV